LIDTATAAITTSIIMLQQPTLSGESKNPIENNTNNTNTNNSNSSSATNEDTIDAHGNTIARLPREKQTPSILLWLPIRLVLLVLFIAGCALVTCNNAGRLATDTL
jgi:hypothetical protein